MNSERRLNGDAGDWYVSIFLPKNHYCNCGDIKIRLENLMCVFYISRLGNKYWCLSNIEN